MYDRTFCDKKIIMYFVLCTCEPACYKANIRGGVETVHVVFK